MQVVCRRQEYLLYRYRNVPGVGKLFDIGNVVSSHVQSNVSYLRKIERATLSYCKTKADTIDEQKCTAQEAE